MCGRLADRQHIASCEACRLTACVASCLIALVRARGGVAWLRRPAVLLTQVLAQHLLGRSIGHQHQENLGEE